ncbi:hypothetical protein DM01DRAFT_1335952, partial [Hesseltinella vesiculosa]
MHPALTEKKSPPSDLSPPLLHLLRSGAPFSSRESDDNPFTKEHSSPKQIPVFHPSTGANIQSI